MMYLLKKYSKVVGVHAQRGFTLLIAVILTSVILAVGLALLDISIKQITLAAASRQSQYAFYNADSALECALYWDSIDTFDYTSETTGASDGPISCEGQTFTYAATAASGNSRTTTFSIPCAGDNTVGDASGDVTITKTNVGATHFYANGYNTCVATSPQRIERGEEAHY